MKGESSPPSFPVGNSPSTSTDASPNGNAGRTAKHLKLMARIRQHIDKHRIRVRHIFVELDESGDGSLSRKEFTLGLKKILEGAEQPLTKAESFNKL